jgi:hypothetical protein
MMSAYICFISSARPHYLAAHPNHSIHEVAAALDGLWEGLPRTERAIYEDAADRLSAHQRQFAALQTV